MCGVNGKWAQSMRLDVRSIESGEVREFYICGVGVDGDDPAGSARRIFAAIADEVRQRHARIARERVFVPDGQFEAFRAARRRAYGNVADEMPVDWLHAGAADGAGGVQVHAIRGIGEWTALKASNHTIGWTFERDGYRWAMTGAVTASSVDGMDAPAEAHGAFETAGSILRQANMDLRHLARTWIYMHDILGWYGEFNEVRNKIFTASGMLRAGDASLVPASTGMGVSPIDGKKITIELFAVSGGGKDCIKRFAAAGKQRCAYEYGSAFARAAEAPTPAGTTLFVSGTAAIDLEGRTMHVGDAAAQTNTTLVNVVSVLSNAGYDAGSVVQAMAYCKTPEIAQIFRDRFAPTYAWPWVIVIGDVCRDDLLFEAEVTACKSKGKGS